MMDKCFRLEVVGAGARLAEVVHISGIRSHPPAVDARVAWPWPRQDTWQARLHAEDRTEEAKS